MLNMLARRSATFKSQCIDGFYFEEYVLPSNQSMRENGRTWSLSSLLPATLTKVITCSLSKTKGKGNNKVDLYSISKGWRRNATGFWYIFRSIWLCRRRIWCRKLYNWSSLKNRYWILSIAKGKGNNKLPGEWNDSWRNV